MSHWTEFEGNESEQLIPWIDWLRTHEVASFIELAVREPSAWAKLREAPQQRRRIASILGWPMTFEGALINEQRLFDVAAVLLNAVALAAVTSCPITPTFVIGSLSPGISSG